MQSAPSAHTTEVLAGVLFSEGSSAAKLAPRVGTVTFSGGMLAASRSS